jgi:hypothetical protein
MILCFRKLYFSLEESRAVLNITSFNALAGKGEKNPLGAHGAIGEWRGLPPEAAGALSPG